MTVCDYHDCHDPAEFALPIEGKPVAVGRYCGAHTVEHLREEITDPDVRVEVFSAGATDEQVLEGLER